MSALQIVTIPPVMYTGLMPPLLGESVDSLIEEAQGRMEGMPDVEGRAVYGVPGEELSVFGAELDLLVVGSRNFGPRADAAWWEHLPTTSSATPVARC